MQLNKYIISTIVAVCFSLIGLLCFDDSIISISLGLCVFNCTLLFLCIGKTLPIVEFMLALNGIQLIIASHISYVIGYKELWVTSSITEVEYLQFALPCYLAFTLGALFFKKDLIIDREKISIFINTKTGQKNIVLLCVVSIIFTILPSNGLIAFVSYLFSNLLYVAALMLLYVKHKNKWLFIGIIVSVLFLSCLRTGIFASFISWGYFLFFYLINAINATKKQTVLLALCVLFFLFVIQSVKQEFRSSMSQSESEVSVFGTLFSDKISDLGENDELAKNSFYAFNSRVNQGQIVLLILDHIPNEEPYVDGESIWSAIKESLLPRFLSPDKKSTYDNETYRRFTGDVLRPGTSIGLSIMGEAYGNFGRNGAILFMFIWGAFVGLVFRMYKSVIETKNYYLIFFSWFLFALTVETIVVFSQVWNYMFKATIFLFVLFWICKKFNFLKAPNAPLSKP